MKQTELIISSPGRGYHLITSQVESTAKPMIISIKSGLLHCFLQHTSASLTINENADPTVRTDFKNFEEELVPRTFPYQHNYEGDDDMPAHIKSSLFGCDLMIPITDGRLALGTWQGIYLCEHRDHAHSRHIVLTVISS